MTVIFILAIIYTVVLRILDRTIFEKVYFGNAGEQILSEIFKTFFLGFVLSVLTVYFWWIAVIAVLIVGAIVALTKAKGPGTRIYYFGIFVVIAVVIGIIGFFAKKDITHNDDNETGIVRIEQMADESSDCQFCGVESSIL